ncbi:MAG: bifunctional UDP-sugar hydrolase/5'-nucleotidase [Kiritimatiellae bacterium]|nr:bifunctional UDP-sugar hydrolase/5'-nucleotidase [Kiritimatiellia bacterium]
MPLKLSNRPFQRNKNLFGRGAALFLFGCGLAALCSGREVEINILHTADLHGHLEPVRVDDREAGLSADTAHQARPAGGLLRCAAIINQIRAEATNAVLIDCGDLFQGSVAGYLTRGDVMVKAVRYLRYDALVVGNHEFDWGVERLRALYRRAEIPVLAAGITAPAGQSLPHARPFLVRQLDGVKLVIIGLTNPYIPNWSRPRLLGGLQFPDTLEALRPVVEQARKIKPDILVLAVHQGWRQWGDHRGNQVNSIAKAFPDFDLIIGAHTHQAVEGQEINRIIYTQAGCYGLWLGRVVLRFDDERRRLTRIEPRLIPVSGEAPPDPELEKLAAADLSSAGLYLRRKVGENKHEITAREKTPGQSGAQTLIAAAISEAVGAEIVFHGGLSAASLPAGAVRMADVWKIVPYENTISKAWLTPAEISEILEENSGYYGKDQFRGIYGLVYELNPRALAGARVRNLCRSDGREIKHGERISFAVNSYDLASAGGRFPRLREIMERSGSRLEETDQDTRAAVVEYIKKHAPLEIEAAPGAAVKRGGIGANVPRR